MSSSRDPPEFPEGGLESPPAYANDRGDKWPVLEFRNRGPAAPSQIDSDPALLGGAAGAESNLFIRDVQAQRTQLCRLILGLVPKQDFEDIVQESYQRFYTVPETKVRTDPGGFLYGIVMNVIREFHRRRADSRVVFDSDVVDNFTDPCADERLTDFSDQKVAAQQVKAVLQMVPPTHRNVLVATQLLGLTHNEAALRLGVSIHTVKKYTNQALSQIRKAMAGKKQGLKGVPPRIPRKKRPL